MSAIIPRRHCQEKNQTKRKKVADGQNESQTELQKYLFGLWTDIEISQLLTICSYFFDET